MGVSRMWARGSKFTTGPVQVGQDEAGAQRRGWLIRRAMISVGIQRVPAVSGPQLRGTGLPLLHRMGYSAPGRTPEPQTRMHTRAYKFRT